MSPALDTCAADFLQVDSSPRCALHEAFERISAQLGHAGSRQQCRRGLGLVCS